MRASLVPRALALPLGHYDNGSLCARPTTILASFSKLLHKKGCQRVVRLALRLSMCVCVCVCNQLIEAMVVYVSLLLLLSVNGIG